MCIVRGRGRQGGRKDCVVLQSNQNYCASTVITVAFVKFFPCDVIYFWKK